MKSRLAVALVAICAFADAAEMARPMAGKTQILPLKDVKPGMHATAWTVFQGTEPEPVPIEIVGVWKNYLGPKGDVIIAKMGGKAKETNVAAGMSGSPVYFEGKLMGAVALRMSTFSPDAVCGITPIESMLEIEDFDKSRPADARTPDVVPQKKTVAAADMPNELMARLVAAGVPEGSLRQALVTPIETPLMFSGFSDKTLNSFAPFLGQMGVTAVQGGSGAGALTAKPAKGWEKSLNPGDAISGVLVSGDMSVTGMGTVTYNDGKKVLAFGHPFFSLGPVDMPMAKSEILMVLASAYQPTKFGNATEVVGALHQDRFSGIMGELGAEAPTIPVHVKIRTLGTKMEVVKERDLHFDVFVHQKWTPTLMMMTLSNSLSQMNEYADEMTYRMSGKVDLTGGAKINLATMFTGSDAPLPATMMLATWWGDKFNRLYLNPVDIPKLRGVDATVDVLPDRRAAAIDSAWTPMTEVDAGSEIPVKVFLRPYRGERIERSLTVKIPAGLSKGEHRILFSDAETLNRLQTSAAANNRYLDIPETVSLLNQERQNNRLYISLVEPRATYYNDDKTLPALPASVLNVYQTERTSNRSLVGIPETVQEQQSVMFDQVVNGSYSLRITVR
jgi:hypothetical protein